MKIHGVSIGISQKSFLGVFIKVLGISMNFHKFLQKYMDFQKKDSIQNAIYSTFSRFMIT